MDAKEGVPVEYTPVEPAVVPEPETETERPRWLCGLFWLVYGLIGSSVAFIISHAYPMYLYCLKTTSTCPVAMVLMDVLLLVTTAAIWPVVIMGLVIGQTIALFL